MGLFETTEERTEVVYLGFEESDLEIEDFLGTFETDVMLGRDRLFDFRSEG